MTKSPTRYFLATFADGTKETRSSPTRAYVKCSRWCYPGGTGYKNVSFHMTMDAATPAGTVEVVSTVEITAKEYRALKAEARREVAA